MFIILLHSCGNLFVSFFSFNSFFFFFFFLTLYLCTQKEEKCESQQFFVLSSLIHLFIYFNSFYFVVYFLCYFIPFFFFFFFLLFFFFFFNHRFSSNGKIYDSERLEITTEKVKNYWFLIFHIVKIICKIKNFLVALIKFFCFCVSILMWTIRKCTWKLIEQEKLRIFMQKWQADFNPLCKHILCKYLDLYPTWFNIWTRWTSIPSTGNQQVKPTSEIVDEMLKFSSISTICEVNHHWTINCLHWKINNVNYNVPLSTLPLSTKSFFFFCLFFGSYQPRILPDYSKIIITSSISMMILICFMSGLVMMYENLCKWVRNHCLCKCFPVFKDGVVPED